MATATPKSAAAKRIKMRLRKGDTVQVITGKDKGKTGEVLRTLPNENRVIVEGVNMRTRHVKPTQEGESGRIVTEEASLHASNVMIFSKDRFILVLLYLFSCNFLVLLDLISFHFFLLLLIKFRLCIK